MGWCERVGGPGLLRIGIGWVGLASQHQLHFGLPCTTSLRLGSGSYPHLSSLLSLEHCNYHYFHYLWEDQPPCTTCNTASSAMPVVQFKKRGVCHNLLRILLINLVPNCSLSILTDLVIMGEVVRWWRRKLMKQSDELLPPATPRVLTLSENRTIGQTTGGHTSRNVCKLHGAQI